MVLAKAEKKSVANKSQKDAIKKTTHKGPGRCVLIGTYKGKQLSAWPGWYNYPIAALRGECGSAKETDESVVTDFSEINELWLFKGTKNAFKAAKGFHAGECAQLDGT